MSDRSAAGDTANEPGSEEIVAWLFAAAMSGDDVAWSKAHDIDPKLLEIWKFSHAREYIAYLENVLRMVKRRAASAE